MRGFNVLERQLPLYRKCFLEASAGTGKTFAIETLVTRMLLEGQGPLLSEILIVTFTKAATRDLKTRISERIKSVLECLNSRKDPPPFLEELFEKGEEEIKNAMRRLRVALHTFEEARIFTIHSFCKRMLEEHALLSSFISQDDEALTTKEWVRMKVKDTLRRSSLDRQEMKLLLKHSRGDIERLVDEVVILTEKRVPIAQGISFEQRGSMFAQEIAHLKGKYALQTSGVASDLLKWAPSFKGTTHQGGALKEGVKEDLLHFASLFEGEITTFPLESSIVQLKKENLKKKAALPFSYLHEMQERLFPLLEEGADELALLSRLAEMARQRIVEGVEREDVLFFEDLLCLMEERVKDPFLAAKVRGGIRAVFIDEFQDTDERQWRIFSRLFATEEYTGALYLVGDPKQSIYRFRHADLYTYFAAKNSLPFEQQLLTNYRSEPPLTSALNTLLGAAGDLFSLPRHEKSFSAPPLLACETKVITHWKDGQGSLHLVEGENEEELLRYAARTFSRLHHEENIPWKEFAVLVKDHNQARRCEEIFQKEGLSVVKRKSLSLIDSPAFTALYDLVAAALEPGDKNILLRALGGPLCGYSHTELKEGRQEEAYFSHLGSILRGKGALCFFTEFLKRETFLAKEGGVRLYSDSMQLLEMAAEKRIGADELLSFFDTLKEGADPETLQCRSLCSPCAVQVLTVHSSKGLEFDIVFPIALIQTSTEKRRLVFDPEKEILSFSKEAFEKERSELEAEKMRLFYVAVTRAKKRLYLPLCNKKGSPLTLFEEKIAPQSLKDLPGMTFSTCDAPQYTPVSPPAEIPLQAPLVTVPSFASSTLHSFSSLSAHKEVPFTHTPSTTLPSGSEFGAFIHLLFEKLPFDKAFRATLQELSLLLAPFLAKTPYSAFAQEITQMVFSTFHALLPSPHPFPLSSVHPSTLIKEREFLYKEGNDFYKGIIDLIFEYQGKIYVIDWKTNDLPGYSNADLQQAMEMHDYYLQASLYKEAVSRFTPHFGGIFYLFLRGMRPQSPDGIFTFPLT